MNDENQLPQVGPTPQNPNNQINPQLVNPSPQPAATPPQSVEPQQPIQQPQAQMPVQPQPVVTAAQTTPETPTHTLPSSDVNQSSVPPSEPSQKHHSHNPKNSEYNSNPFVVAAKGLGSALVENPTSSVLISLIPSIVIIPLFIGVGVLSVILGLAGGAIGALLAGLLSLVILIAFLLLLLRVAAGSVNILLKSVNGEKISTKEAIGSAASGRLTSFVGASFLSSIAIFFGFLLFIIPGIYLLARLSLAPVIVYAEDKKAMESLKRSMALTKGHVFEMLGAITAQSLLSGNGLLTMIGASSGTVKRYSELVVAEKSGITDTGKVHWLNFVLPILVVLFMVPYLAVSVLSATINSGVNTNNDSFGSGSGSFFSSADPQADTIIKTDINSLYQKLEEYYNENGGYPNEAINSSNATSIFSGIDSGALVDDNGNEITVTFEDDFFYSTFPDPSKSNQYALVMYGEGCDGLGGPELCSGYILSGYQSNGINYVKYSLN